MCLVHIQSARVVLCLQCSQTMGRLFPHHLGHYLGLDTHDTMLVDRNTELEPGMVLTIEPGVYLPQDYHLQGSSAATALVHNLVLRLSAKPLNKGYLGDLKSTSTLIRR